jgi:hypothetical protein
VSATGTDHDRAVSLYSRLIALYPRAHREEFALHMQRTFEDFYRHATEGEHRAGAGFWLAVLWDEGRSIVRERAAEPQGDVLFYALVLMWTLAVLFVPLVPAASDWHNLLIPAGTLALFFVAVPGRPGIARRMLTVLVTLAVVEWTTAVAQSMREPNDLLAPMLLVACMAFSIKLAAGVNARIVGIKDAVWGPEELTYGLLAGLAGMMALAFGMVDTNDNNPASGLFFFFVVPLICAVAGFKNARRNLSVRAGTYAAFGTMLVAATIWLLALPLLYQGALLSVYRDHPTPALFPLFWQRPLSITLFWTAINGTVGAFFGVESLRKDLEAPQSPLES